MDIIKSVEHEQLKNKIPELRVGNTVKVHQRIKEGNRERVQVFEGIIIKKQGGGVNATFTVRKIAYGVGVEKTFMVHSPMIEKVEIVRVGKARRAKLYYLRDRVGKAAKTKENIGARIENKEITIKEEMVEEPISEETTTPVENATEEAPAVETENPVVEEVANELGIPVNYLNLTNLSSEESNKLSKSNSYLKKNQWGTPTTLFMVGDKVIDSIGQYVDKDTFVSFVKENIKVDVNE